jgi:ribose transport system substrate-binding protein
MMPTTINRRRRMSVRLTAAAVGLTMVAAACGGDSSESSSTEPSSTEPSTTEPAGSDTETTEPETETTTPSAAEEQNSLEAAWADDWAQLGLENPGLETTDLGITITDTSEYAKEGPYTVGFASQGPTNSWATIYDESMRARAEELGVTIAYAGADGREDKQVNDINDLLAQDIDALIVTPMGPAVKAPVERAAAQGIPVIVCTGTVDSDAYVTRVDRDNRLNGALYAEWIAHEIGYEGQIVMLEGIAGVPTSEARSAAAEEVFAKYPDIEILDKQYTNWSPTEAKTVVEQLVTRFGDEIDAVWSDSGFGAIGVIEVYRDRGMDIPPVTGEPVNAFLKLASETGARVGIVGYPPSHSADCLDAAMATLAGEPLPTFVNVEVPIFDDTQLADWVELECSDDLWVPVDALSPELLAELDLC